MRSINCRYCPSLAVYVCSCTSPGTYFCKRHLDLHESEAGDHNFQLFKKSGNIPNLVSKEKILKKLIWMKTEALASKKLIIEETNVSIARIVKESSSLIEKLSSFIKLCDDYTIEINEIKHIPIKEFYYPLENALISQDIESFLDQFAPPTINYNEETKKYFYVPSCFPHYLYNYSYFSVNFCSENTTQLHPSNKIFINEKFNWSSRLLTIGTDKILITGGTKIGGINITDCFILNLRTNEIQTIAKMNYLRSWHAMTWIKDSPAVIGGINGVNLKSVEIFKNNEWIQIEDINIPRNRFTGIKLKNKVFIIGGSFNFDDKSYEKLDSIEKYENNHWDLLQIKLLIPLSGVALLCVENNILIIGGKDKDNCIRKNAYIFDTKRLNLNEINNINKHLLFVCNSFYIHGYEADTFGHNNLSEIDLLIQFKTQLFSNT